MQDITGRQPLAKEAHRDSASQKLYLHSLLNAHTAQETARNYNEFDSLTAFQKNVDFSRYTSKIMHRIEKAYKKKRHETLDKIKFIMDAPMTLPRNKRLHIYLPRQN